MIIIDIPDLWLIDHPFIIPTIINGDVPGNAEKPPPIPIKKRKQLGTQPMTSPTHSRM